MPTDYKQTDPRWNTLPYAGENINNAGCGPTSDSDLLDITPDVTAAWLETHHYTSDHSGTFWEGIPACLKAFGHDSKQLTYSSLLGVRASGVFDKWKKHVQSGYCGILLMGNSGQSPVKWTNGGHYIAIVDYKDNKYLVYDPASTQRTGWHAWEDFIPSIKILYTSDVPTLSAPFEGYAYNFTSYTLGKGSKGERVKLVQKYWKAIGVYKGNIDGDYGDLSVQACKKWQELHNLEQDGWCGVTTQRSIFNLRSNGYTFYVKHVQYGSEGDSVKLMQCILKSDGYYTGAIDADFGHASENALKRFQSANGLDADGSCGPLTWAKLIGF